MPILTNRRILITRALHQASSLAGQLEALGAVPILIPTIEIVPPESYGSLDAALAQIDSYDWLIFTSANAVKVFHQRCNPSAIPKRIAVIGPATAKAVEEFGLQVDLIPRKSVAESLAEALLAHAPGSRMLLVRAEHARDILPEVLVRAGASVTIAPAYSNRIPSNSILLLQALFETPATYPDGIVFTSASTAHHLSASLEAGHLFLPRDIVLASIGPVTSQAMRDLGYEPTIEAAEPTIPALVQSLVSSFRA